MTKIAFEHEEDFSVWEWGYKIGQEQIDKISRNAAEVVMNQIRQDCTVDLLIFEPSKVSVALWMDCYIFFDLIELINDFDPLDCDDDKIFDFCDMVADAANKLRERTNRKDAGDD